MREGGKRERDREREKERERERISEQCVTGQVLDQDMLSIHK